MPDQDQTTDTPSNVTADSAENWQEKYEQTRAQLLQLMADFENFRKRVDAEKAKYSLLGNMLMITQIFEIIDDLARAQDDSDLDLVRSKQMLEIMQNKLFTSLDLGGLETLVVNKGDQFDSRIMEAVTTLKAESPEQVNTVADVISQAYRHKQTQEIVRTAKVVVFK